MLLLRNSYRIPARCAYESYKLVAVANRNQRVFFPTKFLRQFSTPQPFTDKDHALTKPEKDTKEFLQPPPPEKPDISEPDINKQKLTVKQKLTPKLVRQNVEGYLFTRYFDYLKDYNLVLEKKFPSAVKAYRVFVNGFTDFYNDMRRYLKISKIANESQNGIKTLNRQELELYMQMPRDMYKVAPALICCALPMVGYGAMALVFMYPSVFLTSHFWTAQQKAQFQEESFTNRIKHNREVFRFLQAKLKSLKDPIEHQQMKTVLGLLGSGFHPTVQQILDCKDIFAKPPFNILSLSRRHIKTLTKMHGVPSGLFKRFRLREHAFLIHYMDLAIGREGGVHNMHCDCIRYHCYVRGMNPANLTDEEMVEWLRNWIKVSTSIEAEHLSLFLHLPLLLAYNHPNNWKLIHTDKQK